MILQTPDGLVNVNDNIDLSSLPKDVSPAGMDRNSSGYGVPIKQIPRGMGGTVGNNPAPAGLPPGAIWEPTGQITPQAQQVQPPSQPSLPGNAGIVHEQDSTMPAQPETFVDQHPGYLQSILSGAAHGLTSGTGPLSKISRMQFNPEQLAELDQMYGAAKKENPNTTGASDFAGSMYTPESGMVGAVVGPLLKGVLQAGPLGKAALAVGKDPSKALNAGAARMQWTQKAIMDLLNGKAAGQEFIDIGKEAGKGALDVGIEAGKGALDVGTKAIREAGPGIGAGIGGAIGGAASLGAAKLGAPGYASALAVPVGMSAGAQAGRALTGAGAREMPKWARGVAAPVAATAMDIGDAIAAAPRAVYGATKVGAKAAYGATKVGAKAGKDLLTAPALRFQGAKLTPAMLQLLTARGLRPEDDLQGD